MTNVDLCVFLWDLTTVGPGGTETSVNRGAFCLDYFLEETLCKGTPWLQFLFRWPCVLQLKLVTFWFFFKPLCTPLLSMHHHGYEIQYWLLWSIASSMGANLAFFALWTIIFKSQRYNYYLSSFWIWFHSISC